MTELVRRRPANERFACGKCACASAYVLCELSVVAYRAATQQQMIGGMGDDDLYYLLTYTASDQRTSAHICVAVSSSSHTHFSLGHLQSTGGVSVSVGDLDTAALALRLNRGTRRSRTAAVKGNTRQLSSYYRPRHDTRRMCVSLPDSPSSPLPPQPPPPPRLRAHLHTSDDVCAPMCHTKLLGHAGPARGYFRL